MKVGVYSVKDTKVAFATPFYSHSDETAIRSFTEAVNSETPNAVKQFVEDKQLYRLGYFDDDTGVITSDVAFLVNGVDVLKVGDSR